MLLGCVERVGVLLVWVERVCDHYLPSITEPLSFGRSLTFATKASFVFGDNACCANKLGEGEGEGEGEGGGNFGGICVLEGDDGRVGGIQGESWP